MLLKACIAEVFILAVVGWVVVFKRVLGVYADWSCH